MDRIDSVRTDNIWQVDDPYGFREIRDRFFPPIPFPKMTKEDKEKYREFQKHVAGLVRSGGVSSGAGRVPD